MPRSVAHGVAVAALGLLLIASTTPALLARRTIDEMAAASDVAVVGVLAQAAVVDTGAYVDLWSGPIAVERYVFGETSEGDTLQFFWKHGGAVDLWPYQRLVGRSCVWLLRSRDGDGFKHTFPGAVVDLESEADVLQRLAELERAGGESLTSARAAAVGSYLKGYLDGRRALGRHAGEAR